MASILNTFIQGFLNEFNKQLFPMLIDPVKWMVYSIRGLTFFWVLLLMLIFRNHSTGMYLSLTLHSSYGVIWVVRQMLFKDGKWKQKANICSVLESILSGLLFWVISIPIAVGLDLQHPSSARTTFILGLYFIGLFLMFGSDYQKYKRLQKSSDVVTTGFFKNVRYPSLLGQILTYSSLVLCSSSIIYILILYGLGYGRYLISIDLRRKSSITRHSMWPQYQRQTPAVFPRIFISRNADILLYWGLILVLLIFLWQDPTHLNNSQQQNQNSL